MCRSPAYREAATISRTTSRKIASQLRLRSNTRPLECAMYSLRQARSRCYAQWVTTSVIYQYGFPHICQALVCLVIHIPVAAYAPTLSLKKQTKAAAREKCSRIRTRIVAHYLIEIGSTTKTEPQAVSGRHWHTCSTCSRTHEYMLGHMAVAYFLISTMLQLRWVMVCRIVRPSNIRAALTDNRRISRQFDVSNTITCNSRHSWLTWAQHLTT